MSSFTISTGNMNYFLIAALIPCVAIATKVRAVLSFIIQFLNELGIFQELAGLASVDPSFLFWALFVFRYLRLVVHIISFWFFYKVTPIPDRPSITARNCSIILPTVDPGNPDFTECIESCLRNIPGEIIIVTVGRNMAALTNQIIGPYRTAYPRTNIQVHFTQVASKRVQVAHGVSFAQGRITVLLDDHVFWPSPFFLQTALAPFENRKVGVVGTNKRVRRTDTGFNIRSFWNMIGALYLERHNFEIRATNAIDGGVFVVSGRTALYRTHILKSPGFMQAFTNERFFFGKFGPLNADDDNFLTRQVVARGYDVKIQYSRDAMIETTLGTYPKFLSQCLRWVRTTWRSNSASLFTDRTVWRRQPWCVYAVYLTSFVNFALFYDAALIYTLSRWADQSAVKTLIGWIFCTKMVKLVPYFIREPQDLLMLPGYFMFAYFHSLVKLYAGLTFWVTAWGGRNLDAVNAGGDGGSDDDDDDGDDGHSDHISSGAQTEQPGSHSASEPSNRGGSRRTRRRTQGWVQTNWGFVNNNGNSYERPANVLDNQLVAPNASPRSNRRRRSNTPHSPASGSALAQLPASSMLTDHIVNLVTQLPSQTQQPISLRATYDADDLVTPSRPPPRFPAVALEPVVYDIDDLVPPSPRRPSQGVVYDIDDIFPPTPPPTTPRTRHGIIVEDVDLDLYPPPASTSPPSVVSIPATTPSLASNVSSVCSRGPSTPSEIDYEVNPRVVTGSPAPDPRPINRSPSPADPTDMLPMFRNFNNNNTGNRGFKSTRTAVVQPFLAPVPVPTQRSVSFSLPTPTPTSSSFPTATPPTTPHVAGLVRERRALAVPDTYSKTWTRGKQCLCLHSDRDRLFKTRSCRCMIDDVFGLPNNVVPGRPRF